MIIVSGMSGAGKTVALNTLEDLGYYCVDNLPIILLKDFITKFATNNPKVAVAIDIRDIKAIDNLDKELLLLREEIEIQILFLTANNDVLMRRYAESRRPHPLLLNNENNAQILEAITNEKEVLGNLNNLADIIIDTSTYNAVDLRTKIIKILNVENPQPKINILSFGFKNGIPINADFIFDVRFLPNPFWVEAIRKYNGTEQPIINFMNNHPLVEIFIKDTLNYLKQYLNYFTSNNNRAYLTIGIGCTGGKHRSVFVAEQLFKELSKDFKILIEHRDL